MLGIVFSEELKTNFGCLGSAISGYGFSSVWGLREVNWADANGDFNPR